MESDALWMQLKEKMESLSSSQLSCAKHTRFSWNDLKVTTRTYPESSLRWRRSSITWQDASPPSRGSAVCRRRVPFLMTFLVGLNAFFLYRIDARLDLVEDKAPAIEAKQSNNIFERRNAVKSLEERIMRIEEILKR